VLESVEAKKFLESIRPEASEAERKVIDEGWDYHQTLWAFIALYSVFLFIFFRTTGFWRWYVFWKPARFKSVFDLVWNTILAWFLLTASFAIAGELLLFTGAVENPAGSDPGVLLRDHAIDNFWENFGWQLSDTIPILEIPKTLDWKPSVTFAGTGIGILFLTYKIGVILPLLTAFNQLKKRHDEEADE
jgi:hypothetical protein